MAEPKRKPLKSLERYVSAITKLGRTYGQSKRSALRLDEQGGQLDLIAHDSHAQAERIDAAERRFDLIEESIDDIRAQLRRLDAKIDSELQHDEREAGLRGELAAMRERLAGATDAMAAETALSARAHTDLARRLDRLQGAAPPEPQTTYETRDDALMDTFYNRLEARYRGSREEIMRRLLIYIADARGAHARTGKPVLDIGCGRGEWLELLRERGIPASGVDLNPVQVEEARAAGLDAQEGDACAALAELPDASLAMVTAHHVAEHLPFETLGWIVRKSLRVLAPGGVLLLETPNAHNLMVAAISFHTDPTHLRPLPLEVLTTLLDSVGYHPIETRLLNPHERHDAFVREGRLDPELAGLFFGPQDLAILGLKPGYGDA